MPAGLEIKLQTAGLKIKKRRAGHVQLLWYLIPFIHTHFKQWILSFFFFNFRGTLESYEINQDQAESYGVLLARRR